jgi:hypothetical protein
MPMPSTGGTSSSKNLTNAVRVKKMMRLYDGDTKFPKLEECHHFHYDYVELGSLRVRRMPHTSTTESLS